MFKYCLLTSIYMVFSPYCIVLWSRGAYIEHTLSIHSAYIEHILLSGGQVVRYRMNFLPFWITIPW